MDISRLPPHHPRRRRFEQGLAQSAPVAPRQVTMRQARLALLGAGLLPTVDGVIASLPSPQKEAALIEWEYSAVIDRDNPLIAAMSAALGMTDEQMDALFVQAATL